MNDPLPALVYLTRMLGQPHLDYAIIGEGNTSCRIDAETFWIKASGQAMNGIGPEGFVAVRLGPILAMLDDPALDLAAQQQIAQEARLDPATAAVPSIEVSLHALLLNEPGVHYVGHTHPTAVNRLLCSSRAGQFAANRLFPDEVVLCGPESVLVPYADPGLPLARQIRRRVQEYVATYGETPKVILLQNHGLLVPGGTPAEVLNVTAMCVKAAHIFAGACAVGEPVFMSRAAIMHNYRRPDEVYRRQRFVQGEASAEG